jgi:RNA recognition motif-containing protein
MELYIGNFSQNVTLGDLIAFLKGFSNKANLRFKQKVLEDGSSVRCAIASFENDKFALKMMEKYAGQLFHGRELVIREYLYRSYNNERRAVNWRDKPWRAGERRRDDRRHNEIIKQQDEFEAILASSKAKEKNINEQADNLKVRAYDDFARKS